jgi:hypothetical protein
VGTKLILSDEIVEVICSSTAPILVSGFGDGMGQLSRS